MTEAEEAYSLLGDRPSASGADRRPLDPRDRRRAEAEIAANPAEVMIFVRDLFGLATT
jgi:hypothetical protein